MDSNNKYPLEDRTATFGESVIIICRGLKETTISKPLISQIIRSATSVGANYMEANGASSKADFKNKISICKKESQETKHWLRMLAVCYPEKKENFRAVWKESQELSMIFQKIINTINGKK